MATILFSPGPKYQDIDKYETDLLKAWSKLDCYIFLYLHPLFKFCKVKQLFCSLLRNLLSIINYEFSYFNFAMFSYFTLRIEIWIYEFF